MKVIKKPVIIEAIIFEGKTKGFSEKPLWLINAINKKILYVGRHNRLHIETSEGIMEASKGDYIIKGVKGDIHACNPGVFHETYEIIES